MFIALLALHDTPDPSWERILALAESLARREESLLVCRAGSSLAVAAANLDVPLLLIPAGSSSFHPLSLLRLWLRLRKKRRVLLQSFDARAATFARIYARLHKPKKSLLVPTFFFACEAGNRAFRKNLETADRIVCGSEAFAEELRQPDGIESGKFRTISPGTLPTAYPERRRQDAERFVICMHGPLTQGGGQRLLIRAMSALWQIEGLPPWEVRLLGSGPMFSELLEEARTFGVLDRLAILGQENLHEVLPRSNALVLPFGETVYAPYFAAGRLTGLPVIAPDLPACREFARHGHDALLIIPDNPQDLAAAVLRLIREPDTARALALNGKSAFAPIGMERMIENFSALYRELLTAENHTP